MSEQTKPHVVRARVSYGEIDFFLDCPDDESRDRPCLMGEEPRRCEWHEFELGMHHDTCPARQSREDEDCIAPEGSDTGCWSGEPEECDGFENPEWGHLHPMKGCWAQQTIDSIGWEDAVSWGGSLHFDQGSSEISLPLEVAVSIGEDCCTFIPWNERTDQ